AHSHGHGDGHAPFGLREILALLDATGRDPEVRGLSARLFHRLAAVESAIHGVSPEQVHFHEVGAVDSIVDVVGGVIGLRWLRADRFVASPLTVGPGTVTMSHGTFAVPPPAPAPPVGGGPVSGPGGAGLVAP